ncbi:MAG: hypothetical protein HY703_09565 [Gemmatimonadetes bacterium]|nr:hypothetical protein [Gemmatimonadota bacterium]
MNTNTPGPPGPSPSPSPSPRTAKFRQAAFFYLHVGLLYEAAVWVTWREGLLPQARTGLVWLWLLLGALIVAFVFWALWVRESKWVARVVWALGVLRLPALVRSAFFPAAAARVPPEFYLVALLIVLINLWLLARAGWDL